MLTTTAVVVIPLIAVVVVLGRWTYNNAEQQSLRIQQQVAAEVESEVRARILAVETQLVLLDEVLALGALTSEGQHSTLESLLANNPVYQNLSVFDATGGEIARVSRSGVVGVADPTSSTGQAIASVIETRDAYFGQVRYDETLRGPLATVAVPLQDRRSGTIDSVVVATIRFQQIWDLLSEIAQPGDSDVYVVTRTGLIVAHANPAVVLSGTEIALPQSDGHAVGLSGQDVVVATHTLHVGQQELTVVAEQSTSTALRVADRTVEVMFGVTLVGLVLAITLVVLAVRHIVRPIEGLASSANKIADGDLSHRADPGSRGEIAQLARSFNTMTDRLSDEIRSLESRVSKRTNELEHSAAVQAGLIEQLEDQAANDFLTGLPNRYSLESRLDIELTRARRLHSRVGLLLLDLDDFKGVNDTFGHATGDRLLIAVGERLQQTLRDVDVVCRLGGDEFAIVQPDVADREHAASLAERLLGVFAESFEFGSHEIFISVSIGVSVADGQTTSMSEFMQQADLALYRAKGEGRNTYRFFEGAMNAAIRRRVLLSQDLRGALERDELFLEYQPQIRLEDSRIVGVEALLRWRHPRLGIIAPTELVPIAEGAGLIDEVGEWVLRTSCTQVQNWRSRGLPALPVAVNVSALQVREPGFVDKVSRILNDSGLEPGYLELELTENVLMEAKEHVGAAVETLHEFGVGISLDDFGRGYASLDYVRRYPLSKIKIDSSFVQDMLTNRKSAAIVGAVIDLAAKLDLPVIAEGVEFVDLVERLADEGCMAVQGFYFSRPVPADEMAKLLTNGNDRIQGHLGTQPVVSAVTPASNVGGIPAPPTS